jgi:hypothetical protein
VWPLFGSGNSRGKTSTPSIGWEVPGRSHRSERGSWTECAQDNDLGLLHLAMLHFCIFVLNGSLNNFLVPSITYFYCVKVYVLFSVTLSKYFILSLVNCLDEPNIL